MGVGRVGDGMMGVWHPEVRLKADAVLRTLVGRRPDAAQAFADRFGCHKVTGALATALADPAVDIVILCSPSERHETQSVQCLEVGEHAPIEIPITMSLTVAERVVAAGERSGKVYGLGPPMGFRKERRGLLERVRGGEGTVRHVAGRFFIDRVENVGASGYRRNRTDNILWHHFCHIVDLGPYRLDGASVHRVQSHYGPCHPRTGIPVECVVLVEIEADRTLLVHGSYHAADRIDDELIVTDRDTCGFDVLAGTLRTAPGEQPLEAEQANRVRMILDFVDAVTHGRPPLAAGPSVLPAMRVLQTVQDDRDRCYGARAIPGRPEPMPGTVH